MENLKKADVVPPSLLEYTAGRDTTPLSPEMLVRYQYIALVPTRATNFRYVVYQDGRLHYAVNSEGLNDPIYNTSLPDAPNRVLDEETMSAIRQQLEAADFFAQPAYVANTGVRGGALSIVTARRNNRVHEVFYENVDNGLTNFLFGIGPEQPVEQTPEEEMAYWQGVLDDLEQKAASQEATSKQEEDDAA